MLIDCTTYTNEYTCPWCWYVHRKPCWSRGCTGCGKEVANWKALGKKVIFYPDREITIDETILLPYWKEKGQKIPWKVPNGNESPSTPIVRSPSIPGLGYKVPAPPPVMLPPTASIPASPVKPVHTDPAPVLQNGEWACGQCTYQNVSTAAECELCKTSNPDPIREMEILGISGESKDFLEQQLEILSGIERRHSKKTDVKS